MSQHAAPIREISRTIELVPPVPTQGPSAAPAVQVTATAATTSVMAASAVVGASSGGAALDLQAMVLIGMTDCANSQMKSVADSSKRTVSPLPFPEPKRAGPALGNLVIAAAVGVLHLGAAKGASKIGALQEKGVEAWTIGRTAVRFPSFSFEIFNMLAQGIALTSFGILMDAPSADETTPGDYVVAVIGVLTLVIIALVPVVWIKRRGTPHAEYLPYKVSFVSYPRIVRQLVLPKYFWEPNHLARQLRGVFGWLDGPRCYLLVTLPLIRSIFLAIAVNLPIRCKFKLWLAAMVFLVYALILVVGRVNRATISTIWAVLLSLVSAFVILTGIWPESLGDTIGPCMIAMTVLSVLSIVSGTVVKFKERAWRVREMEAIEQDGVNGGSNALNVPMLGRGEDDGDGTGNYVPPAQRRENSTFNALLDAASEYR